MPPRVAKPDLFPAAKKRDYEHRKPDDQIEGEGDNPAAQDCYTQEQHLESTACALSIRRPHHVAAAQATSHSCKLRLGQVLFVGF